MRHTKTHSLVTVVGQSEFDDVAVVVALGPRVEQRVGRRAVDAQFGDLVQAVVPRDGWGRT